MKRLRVCHEIFRDDDEISLCLFKEKRKALGFLRCRFVLGEVCAVAHDWVPSRLRVSASCQNGEGCDLRVSCVCAGTVYIQTVSNFHASSALKGCRAAPALQRVAVDGGVRQELFAGADDSVVAQAMKEVYEFAFRESKEFPEDGFGNWNRVPPPEADAFIRENVG